MKIARRSSGSGLFLIELIIAIFFFAVASAVCMQLFVGAHLTTNRSEDLTQAVTAGQSAAEAFKYADGNPSAIATLLRGSVEDGAVVTYYDDEWQAVPTALGHAYILRLELQAADGMHTADITVTGDDGEIYALRAKKYVG